MSAKILDGTRVAQDVLSELSEPLTRLAAEDRTPHIVTVQAGETAASAAYLRGIRRNCDTAGIRFSAIDLGDTAQHDDFVDRLAELGRDTSVTGVMIQFPLPPHLDGRALQAHLPPGKDVEAITPTSLGRLLLGESRVAPCTALAALQLLDHTGVELRGAECCVVGMSEIVGKPVAILLLDRFATTTVCHVETRDLVKHTRSADILIVATGRPHLIGGDMIKPGATVIDIGYNQIPAPGENPERKSVVVGDVVYEEAVEVAGWITPVPGGVGPVTRSMLLRNAVDTVLERTPPRPAPGGPASTPRP